MRIVAIILGVLGGIVGLFNAIFAFIAVGGDPAYSYRLWADWAALVLAVLAGVSALFIFTRPVLASFVMLILGIAGFFCINLFYINTFYILAPLLWIIGLVVALISAGGKLSAS